MSLPSLVSTRPLLLFFSLLLALCGAPAASHALTLSSQEQAIVEKLKSSKRPFIKVDPILTQVARQRAADMARRGYFSHVNPDGYGPNYLAQKAGYKLPEAYGNSESANYIESIAAGQTSPSSVWSDWMGSSGHKRHLMAETDFYAAQTNVGVGYVSDPGSDYITYWVVLSAPPQPVVPSLTITAPAQGLQTSAGQVTLTGTSGTTGGVASIAYRVESLNGAGPFLPASGTSTYSANVSLVPGPNTIRVRSLNASGGLVAEALRNVTYLAFRPLTIGVSGAGSVTRTYMGTTSRALGFKHTVVAVPAAGNIFTGWSGSSNAKTASLTFTMAEGFNLTANFAPNPFLTRAGSYLGLLQGANGSLVTTVTTAGAFTGRLVVNGASYALAGRFGADGTAQLTLPGNLQVALQLDVNGTGGVSANVSGAVTASTQAGSLYKPTAAPYSRTGVYTVVLPPNPQAGSNVPQGDGMAVLVVDRNGVAKLSGALADGTSIALTSRVLANDSLAFYLPLYAGKGFLNGTAYLRTTSVSDLDGSALWVKPEQPTARIHPEAVNQTLPLVGSRYYRPTAGRTVISVPVGAGNSTLSLAQGNLASEVEQAVTISPANVFTPSRSPLNSVRVAVNVVNGVFSGTFTHPETKALTVFRGVVLQKQNAGYGFFLGATQSGSVSLTPTQQ